MERIREAIALCLDVEGAPEQNLEFVGIQRVTIAHEQNSPGHRERPGFELLRRPVSWFCESVAASQEVRFPRWRVNTETAW
jgi:hypothetical protein